ncbi:MAG TPA: ATP-grasp domain-containing protein [Acidimicrobiales bacterium]|nr:ATP-grasp domain-containing protein [Acidimicrobiales bacterium]
MQSDKVPTLVLLGAGDPDYRGYALRALSQQYRVILIDQGPTDGQAAVVHRVLCVECHDPDAVLEALGSLELRVDGVLTYDEFCVEAAAEVAMRLGLPHNDPGAARRCRDKASMRKALAAAAVPSARSIPVVDVAGATAAASALGYPVVLKPSALAGSIGVVRVDHPDDLAGRFAESRSASHGTYGASTSAMLVEEYLDGPEVSVESVVWNGSVQVLAVTRKALGPAPYFEEIGHTVAPGEPLPEQEAIIGVAIAAHAALGVRWGGTHTELRLTSRGPRVIELAARPAGDLIPLLVRLTTGLDQTCLAAAALTRDGAALTRDGAAPLPPAVERRAAAVRFFYPPHDLELSSFELQEDALNQPWLHQFCCEARPGQELRLPPRGFLDRAGFAIVVGPTERVCQERLDEVSGGLRLTGKPLHQPA